MQKLSTAYMAYILLKSMELFLTFGVMLYLVHGDRISSNIVYAQLNSISNSNSSLVNLTAQGPLKVLFTVFGIDKTTGDILGFINVKNQTNYKILNSSDLDKDRNGQGQFIIVNTKAKVDAGDQYEACIVLLKTMQRDCVVGYKLPNLKTDFVAFSVKSVIS
jgi:hypothetical protein